MKKRILAAIAVAGVGLTSGGAYAAIHGNGRTAMKLNAGQAVTFAGITCTTYAGNTATNANIVCVRDNLEGYGVVVSQNLVIVAKQVKGKVVVAFKHANQ